MENGARGVKLGAAFQAEVTVGVGITGLLRRRLLATGRTQARDHQRRDQNQGSRAPARN